MAWVRIPPLPRSFVPPKRRLLFAAGSRPAGRGVLSITSRSAVLRSARRHSPPPSGYGMQAGRRSAVLATRPRACPCPHRPPAHGHLRAPASFPPFLALRSRLFPHCVPGKGKGICGSPLTRNSPALGDVTVQGRPQAPLQGGTTAGLRSFTFPFIFPHMQ